MLKLMALTGYLEQLADVDGDGKADLVQNWAQGSFLGMLVWSVLDIDKIESFFHELDRRPDDKFDLIQTHAPRVHMAVDEKWRISSVDFFLDNTDRKCCLEGKNYLSPKNWTNDIYDQDNFPFFRGYQGQLNGNVPIYAFWSRKGTTVDVGYYMFFPFNEGNITLADWDHVGDWEAAFVRFKLDIDSTPMTLQPFQVGTAAHGDTPIWRSFVNIPKVSGTHPIVYEAWGSHGTYPEAGSFDYDNSIFTPDDETSAGEAWDTWFNVVAFDVLRQQALPSQKHWPRWIISERDAKFWLDVDNDNGGNVNLDLPVYRWGPQDNGSVGPAGPLNKAIMRTAKSLPYDTDSDGQDNNIDDDDDNDLVPDRCDVFPQISLSGAPDTDSDGVPNDCDGNCIIAGMAEDVDDDNDGVLDINDVYPTISITRNTGVTGSRYNCDFPYMNLTGYIDSDSDGAPNDCNSACMAAGMLADDDDDNDGVLDINDAYPTISITGYLDSDSDGVPNDCDIACISAGMANADNCVIASNPSQLDTDNDGFGNYCDPDFDNNLIVNAADLAYFKTKFFSTDPDADLNGNGIVNAADLAILKTMFFKPPGPSGLVP